MLHDDDDERTTSGLSTISIDIPFVLSDSDCYLNIMFKSCFVIYSYSSKVLCSTVSNINIVVVFPFASQYKQ